MASTDASTSLPSSDAVIQALNAIGGRADYTEAERYNIALAARRALSRVESPWDTMLHYSMGALGAGVALKTFFDLDLFGKWTASGDDEIDVDKLVGLLDVAQGRSADDIERIKTLVTRLLRHLSTKGLVTQKADFRFAQTDFTRALRDPPFAAWIPLQWEYVNPLFTHLPEYFRKFDYAIDIDGTTGQDGPLSGALGYPPGSTIFDMLKAQPQTREYFGLAMGGAGASRESWVDGIYPYQENLVDGHDGDSVLLVDVGGGKGHDLEKLRAKLPQYAEKLVLQDLAPTFANGVLVGEGVVVMVQDFFAEQQTKHPRAFYSHHCLHDWSNADAEAIARRLREAAKPGYTKLLLNEAVVPELAHTGHPQVSTFDMAMMTLKGAHERTAAEWGSVMRQAGWELDKVWSKDGVIESVLEFSAV